MSDCVFSKHREVLRFEDFHSNHPAIYLCFVIYNWLALGMLPNLHEDESVESVRIKILQENNYLLDVLTTIINCTLGIRIELNEKLFQDNVRALKEITSISKQTILPFVTIENYMSTEDSIMFLDKLSRYFPPNAITKSTDAVPCSKLYNMVQLSGTQIWGSPYWSVLHLTTYVVDIMAACDLKKDYQEILCCLTGFIDLLLPCSLCRAHYSSIYRFNEEEDFPRPFQLTLPYIAMEYAKTDSLFEFYSLLHYNCKPMENKERLDVKFFKNIYEQFSYK
jgi:hypothetical protein